MAARQTKFKRVVADEVDATVLKQNGSAVAAGGDVAGPASSVDSEIALFSGTGGKTLKRASLTGLVKATSGVPAAAVAGTDYLAPDSSAVAVQVLSVAVGGGAAITKILKGTVDVTLDGTISAGAARDQTFTIPGAAAGDAVILNPPGAIQEGGGPVDYLTWYAWVSGADTLTIRFLNQTAQTWSTTALGLFTYVIIKS